MFQNIYTASSFIVVLFGLMHNCKITASAVSSTNCTSGGNTTCAHAESNSICVGSNCKCKPGYKENTPDTSKCILVLGADCHSANDCPAESNTDCTGSQSTKCFCKPNFTNSSGICITNAVNNNNNQRPAAVSSIDCTSDGNTTCTTAEHNSFCFTNMCKCKPGYKENPDDHTKCIPAAVSSIDCTSGGNTTCTAAEHNSFCFTNMCKCKPGFKENPDDHTKCILVLGANCQAANECPAESNTECTGSPSQKCGCKSNFSNSSGICIANAANNNNNQRPSAISSLPCPAGNATCTAAEPSSFCDANKCKCKPGFIENAADTSKCILDSAAVTTRFTVVSVGVATALLLFQQIL